MKNGVIEGIESIDTWFSLYHSRLMVDGVNHFQLFSVGQSNTSEFGSNGWVGTGSIFFSNGCNICKGVMTCNAIWIRF